MVHSVGLLLHRVGPGGIEVLLGHMGGPYWARKDDRGWSIPKGLRDDIDVDLVAAAEREFREEVGPPPAGPTLELGEATSGRKRITVFARAGDFAPAMAQSNTFTIEWPPRSGTLQEFPEIDRVAWFDLDTARIKLVASQAVFIDRLTTALG